MEERTVLILMAVVFFGAIVVFFPKLFESSDPEESRRNELSGLSQKLKLKFNPSNNFELAEQYSFLNQLRQGDVRYAFNVLGGHFGGHPIVAFDFHFAGHSENAGRVRIQHYYLSILCLKMKSDFPELTIANENWKAQLSKRLGYDDIDFESAEFSRTFCVRSKDKKFAYDVCNGQMMEYLLANGDLSIEIEANVLALAFDKRLASAEIEANLQRLLEIRLRLPDYLFTKV